MDDDRKLVYAVAAPVQSIMGGKLAVKIPLHLITVDGVEESSSANIWLSFEEVNRLRDVLLRSTIL